MLQRNNRGREHDLIYEPGDEDTHIRNHRPHNSQFEIGNSQFLQRLAVDFVEALAVSSADGKCHAVAQQQPVVAVEERLEVFDAVDVHYRGLVNPQEFFGIHLRFQPAHSLADFIRRSVLRGSLHTYR